MTDAASRASHAESGASREDFSGCACSGRNLSKLVGPTALAILARKPLHGYQIAREIGEKYFPSAPPNHSSIYRILKDLEGGGYVVCRLEEPAAGPVRKVYDITDSGRECLAEWTRTLREYGDAIDEFLRLAES